MKRLNLVIGRVLRAEANLQAARKELCEAKQAAVLDIEAAAEEQQEAWDEDQITCRIGPHLVQFYAGQPESLRIETLVELEP